LFQVFGDRILGVMKYIIPVGVALSTFGCALSSQFAVARLCYVAGREGHVLEAFSYIHVRRLTPAPAVILQVSNTASRYPAIYVVMLCLKWARLVERYQHFKGL
jgi:Amino acid transporters